MLTKDLPVLFFCLFSFLSLSSTNQEHQGEPWSNPAEEDGKVVIRVWYTTIEEFSERQFKDVSAKITSTYCSRAKDNCAAEDKHIRSNDVIVVDTRSDNEADVQVHVYIRDYTNDEEAALTDEQLAYVYRHYDEDFLHQYGKPVTVIAPPEEHWVAWRIAVVTVSACIGALALIGAAVILKNIITSNRSPGSLSGSASHTPDEVSRHLQLYESVKEKRGDTVNSYDNLAFSNANNTHAYDNNVHQNGPEAVTVSKESPTYQSSYMYVEPETSPTTIKAEVNQYDVTKEQTKTKAAGVYIEIIPDHENKTDSQEENDEVTVGDDENEYEEITQM